MYGYDPNYVTPYTQNFNLSVTSSIRRNMTIDLRYIGTQSKKQESDINLNLNNIYFNQELYDALDAARRGEDPLLLTQMMAGLNLSGAPATEGYAAVGTVNANGVYQTGAAHLRRSTTYRTNLLNGNYLAVVNSLLTDTAGTGYVSNTTLGVTPSARILRNGCDRIATQSGSQTFGTGANAIHAAVFPRELSDHESSGQHRKLQDQLRLIELPFDAGAIHVASDSRFQCVDNLHVVQDHGNTRVR